MLGRVAILGGGPCGLACADELTRLGHGDWVLYERELQVGGLARSQCDPQGFTWDLGGHVVFSHFGEFDALLARLMGEEVLRHDRSSYVRFDRTWVPYPFQNNLRHLPPDAREECLQGLREAPGGDPSMDFGHWMAAVFGAGITRHFMAPYNLKVWATPPARMSCGWIAERVSVVDYDRAAASVRDGVDDLAWGPNNHFAFPAHGGTGEIWRRLGAELGERVECGRTVVGVDAAERFLRLADGAREPYDALVSTMPLDLLVGLLDDAPDTVRAAGAELEHNSVYVVGIGYGTPLRDTRSWLYFPGEEAPFYRATNFAKYAPANVPGGETSRYCSYMTEVAHSPQRPHARAGLEERVEAGLRAAGVVEGRPALASAHVIDVPYAYPVPTLGRDAALAVIQPWLGERAILSRGRFGSWRYEVGNMDHAAKMGIDAARRLARGDDEEIA
ncbi:MAG TPA: FAD-dependent oxidoreductase [Solirubrobacteraceae bacterium]|nr:FAD-dependent oxidoreductase [Solirubrobacteraceae bacterium]